MITQPARYEPENPDKKKKNKKSYKQPNKNAYNQVTTKEVIYNVLAIVNKCDQIPNRPKKWKMIERKVGRYLYHSWLKDSRGISNPLEYARVDCKLGMTMTVDDVINNRLFLSIKIAIPHEDGTPFTIITIKQ